MANIIREDIVKVNFDVGSGLKELQKLQNDVNELKKKLTGDMGSDSFEDLKNSAEECQKPLKKVKEQAEKVTKSVSDIGKKAATVAFNGLKKLAGISLKALIVGVGAVAAAVGKIGYEAVKSFADFEQLKGGVETLFKDNANTVLKYANNAYKTAGLSANEYMETVTSFSASLLQSLGGDTKAAAKYADLAISDMSDNANKMGTDMSSIQYAYQGFAKQNYTMLDNLKLGYGGTKEEMQRLVKDAAKIDKSIDANSLSYANVVKAIHAVQDNMGITGTTAKEAEHTITGSLNSMKSAWGNLLTAMASGENLDQCIDNMVDSVEIFGKNVIPVAERALGGIGKVVERLAPIIAEKLPSLAKQLLPPLIKAAVSLTKGLIKALPDIVKTVVGTIGEILGEQFPALSKFGDFFEKNGKKIEKFIPILLGLVGAFMLMSKIKSIGSFFSNLTGGGKSNGKGGIFSGLADLAKMKTTEVLKGMTNLAIVLGGFTILSAAFMAIAPDLAQLGDTGSFLKMALIVTVLGIVGGVLTKFAQIASNIPVSAAVKGLANMAIIMAGMSALFLLIGAVSLIKFDFGAIVKVIGVITLLGVVGGVLAIFAGIVGLIPVPVVLLGLANMALILAGVTALIVAFGALTKIKGFNDFVERGGDLLVKIFNIIGRCVGSIIGGIGEGISNSLPVIGENLSKFATSLTPFFTVFQSVDTKGVGEFLTAIGKFMITVGASEALSFFTGGTDFSGVAEGLATFAESDGVKKFFNMVNSIEETAFQKGKLFFECLDGVSNLPNAGGLANLFGGKNDFSGVAEGLKSLSSEGVKNFFAMVNGMEQLAFDNAKLFFECMDAVKSLPNSGGLAQLFGGKNDFSGVAEGLKTLSGEGVRNFFAMIAEMEAATLDKALSFFECMGAIKKLPNTGSLANLFGGKNDFSGVASGLKSLTGAKSFFTMVGELPEKAYTNTKKLFKALAGIGEAFPNTGGLGQLFTGENDISGVGKSLKQFGADTKSFFTTVSGLKNIGNLDKVWSTIKKASEVVKLKLGGLYNKGEALSNFMIKAKTFFTILSGTSGLSKLSQLNAVWTTIKQASKVVNLKLAGLYNKGIALSNFMTHAKGFFEGASSVAGHTGAVEQVTNSLKNFFNIIDKIKTVSLPEFKQSFATVFGEIATIVDDSVSIMVEKISELPEKMGKAMSSNSHALSSGIVDMWKDAVKASVQPVNKLLEGANHILKEFGSKKKVISWEPYAKGTSGHKGGNALVNDGNGAELVQMPNGNTFIPKGRNILIPNAPKGMKVLPADRTAQFMGKNSPTFKYADGIGDIDVWSYYDNAKGLVDKISETISYEGLSNLASNVGKSMVSTFTNEMPAWVEKLYEECGQSLGSYVASKGVTQWLPTVVQALKMEGQYSLANVARTLFQMRTESGGNPRAINLWDSNAKKGIPSKGLMQVIDPTFKAYARNGFDKNIYDPLSNILASIRYAVSRYGSLSKAYRGVGYANGGLVTKTGVIAEKDKPEWVIPTDPTKRGRALSLYRQAGQSLGLSNYTPESSGDNYVSNSVENITYAPQLSFTISGTNDDRILARKIKKTVQEALEDVVESASRSNPKLREV